MSVVNDVPRRDDQSPAHSVSGVSVSRRVAMQMIVAAPALVPCTALATDHTDAELFALWRKRIDLQKAAETNSRLYSEAESRMPAWAQPGPAYMKRDGSYDVSRGEVGWPEVENPQPPKQGNCTLVRLSLFDLKRFYNTHPLRGRPAIRAQYRKRARAFVARRREQLALENAYGVTQLEKRGDEISDEIITTESRIAALVGPHSFNALAAVILIAMEYEAASDYTLTTLATIQPLLTGEIAEEAATFYAKAKELYEAGEEEEAVAA